jgi:hypothetical protein
VDEVPNHEAGRDVDDSTHGGLESASRGPGSITLTRPGGGVEAAAVNGDSQVNSQVVAGAAGGTR